MLRKARVAGLVNASAIASSKTESATTGLGRGGGMMVVRSNYQWCERAATAEEVKEGDTCRGGGTEVGCQ